MIKLENLTPKVYSNQSRDFQEISELYNVILNSIKTNADTIYNYPLSQNSNEKLIDLLATTLGFQSKHNYNLKQLISLCSVFTSVLRKKGTLAGIEEACYALLSAEGITQQIDIDTDELETKGVITIFIPRRLSDTNLLRDLLSYILPAGISCTIVKEARIEQPLGTEFAIGQAVVKSVINSGEQYKLPGGIGSTEDKLKARGIQNITIHRTIKPSAAAQAEPEQAGN